jgi:hypothetical protein
MTEAYFDADQQSTCVGPGHGKRHPPSMRPGAGRRRGTSPRLAARAAVFRSSSGSRSLRPARPAGVASGLDRWSLGDRHWADG